MAKPPLRDVGSDPDPRFTFANERTYLAWNRTALALIGAGLAAAELLHFDSRAVRLVVSLPPILVGGVLAWMSYGRWEANERAMRLQQPLPAAGPPRFLAATLAVVAFAIVILVLADAIHP
jgi:putative membrane protein